MFDFGKIIIYFFLPLNIYSLDKICWRIMEYTSVGESGIGSVTLLKFRPALAALSACSLP
jgi:hypothetical protein